MANELTKTEIKKIKIEQGKIDDLNSKLSNEFEIIENSFVVQTNTALMKNSINGDFDEWKNKQKITRNQLKKDLKVSKENCKTIVNKSLDDTLMNVNTAIMGIANQKIEKIDRVNLKAIANKGINLCSDQALKNFDKSVAKVYKLKNQMPLFDAILKQTQEGIENGLKIAYKNGRQVSFKSYMEMNVRTTTRQEANEYLFKASKSNGVVFYVSSSFGDCADDHKDYQGKYYYDKDYKSFGYDKETLKRIKDVIAKYNMRSYQDVVNNKPYLTTRPNCRHTLRPVVLDDVFSNKTPEDMMKQYNIKKGTYHTGNYKALQRQRYNERMIRKYKTRLEQDKLLYEQNPNPKLKQLIDKDNELINYWENEQDKLLGKYKFLKRDRRREDNKVLVQDLGAGYSLGLKIDGKNMFVKEKVKTDIIKLKTKQAEKPKDIVSSGKVEVKEKTLNAIRKPIFPEIDGKVKTKNGIETVKTIVRIKGNTIIVTEKNKYFLKDVQAYERPKHQNELEFDKINNSDHNLHISFLEQLNNAEKNAIKKYSKFYDEKINSSLRNETENLETKKLINTIDNIFEKTPPFNHNTITYRGIDSISSLKKLIPELKETKNNDDIIEKIKNNNLSFQEKGYMSTSSKIEVAEQFGDVIFEIKSTADVKKLSMQQYSEFYKEDEVLFERNLKLKLIDAKVVESNKVVDEKGQKIKMLKITIEI